MTDEMIVLSRSLSRAVAGNQPPITRDNSLPCPYVYIVAQSKYILLYPIITPENSKMNSSWCTRPCQGSNLS